MVKDPDYWNPGAIKLSNVEILQIAVTSRALSMFENDELDFVDAPSNLHRQYEQKGLAVRNIRSSSTPPRLMRPGPRTS